MIVLVKLIAAHMTGDFFLRPDRLNELKNSKDLSERLPALCAHGLIQALLAYVFVGQWSNWLLPVIIAVTHILIDYIKVQFGKKPLVSFLVDQIAHCICLVLVWFFMFHKSGYEDISCISSSVWFVLVSYLAVLTPTSVLIKEFMEYEGWISANSALHGLPNAGKWIGYLERILILTFIYSGNIEGIGFLLAAKSIFRFGELNRARDLHITEYILIGTLASFTIAIIIGLAVRWLMTFNYELF